MEEIKEILEDMRKGNIEGRIVMEMNKQEDWVNMRMGGELKKFRIMEEDMVEEV